MSFIDLAEKRYSVRHYMDMPVEEEKIRQVLEAGRLAPSACNNQPWYFVVVTDKKKREELGQAGNSLKNTPVLIAVCGDHAKSWKRWDGKDHLDVDMAIAAEHMALAAAELGLGTCWVCAFKPDICSKVLGLPKNVEPVVILRLGYPASGSIPEKSRKSLDEIVCRDYFDK